MPNSMSLRGILRRKRTPFREAGSLARLVLAVACGVAFVLASASPVDAQAESSLPASISSSNPYSSGEKEPSGFYFEAFPEFTTGTYGTGSRADTFSLPLTLGYDRNSIVASVTVPFVVIESAGTVSFVGGKPTAVHKTKKAGKGESLEGGLGDILLSAGYYVLEEKPDQRPFVLLEGEVKCPTASSSKGLGTGKFDELLQGTVGMTFFDHLKGEVRLGYEFIGQPSNVPEKYHDTVDYDVGAGYAFNAKNELWARIQGNAPAIVQGTTAPAMILFEYDHFGDRSRFYAEIGFGLTSGAADFLLALGVRFDF